MRVAALLLFVALAAAASLTTADPNGCVPVRQQLRSHLTRLDDFVTGKAQQAAKKSGSQKPQKQKSKQQSIVPTKGKGTFLQISSRIGLKSAAASQAGAKLLLQTYKVSQSIKDNFATLKTIVEQNKQQVDFNLGGFTMNCEAAAFMKDEAETDKADGEAAGDKKVLLKAQIMYYSVLAELMWEAEEQYAKAANIPGNWDGVCHVPPEGYRPAAKGEGDHIMNFALIGTPLFDSFLKVDRKKQDEIINSLSAAKKDLRSIFTMQKIDPSVLNEVKLKDTDTDNNAFLFDPLRSLLLQAMYPYVKGKAVLDAVMAKNMGLITEKSYDDIKKAVYKIKDRSDWEHIDDFNKAETPKLLELIRKKDFTVTAGSVALDKAVFDFVEALPTDDALLRTAFDLMTLSAVDLTALVRACHEPRMTQMFKYTPSAKKKPGQLIRDAPFSVPIGKEKDAKKMLDMEADAAKLCLTTNVRTADAFIKQVTDPKKPYEQKITDEHVVQLCKEMKEWADEEFANKQQVWKAYKGLLHALIDSNSFGLFLAALKK